MRKTKKGRFLPIHAPSFGGNEWKYLKACIDTGWVSSAGPFVDRFEKALSRYVGGGHAVATVNGTAALHVALRAVGVGPGDEVLTPDITFVAPINAVHYCGARPILIGADPQTLQMDAGLVERFLKEECAMRRGRCVHKRTGKTVRAVVPVHLLGLACDIDRIVRAARKYRLKVVEDCAEGVGVRYRGRHVGTFGDIGAFSFNGNKTITAGGGGMLVSKSRKLADYARYLTTQAKDDPVNYIHKEIGYNYRLTNLQAAVGLAQLEQAGTFLKAKRRTADRYQKAFSSVEAITPLRRPPHVQATFWLYTILLAEGTTLRKRNAVLRKLWKKGVGARSLWHPMHGLAPNKGCRAYRTQGSDRIFRRALSLPSSVSLTAVELRRCTDALIEAV